MLSARSSIPRLLEPPIRSRTRCPTCAVSPVRSVTGSIVPAPPATRLRPGAAELLRSASVASCPMKWWSACRPIFRAGPLTSLRVGTGSPMSSRRISACSAPRSTAGASPIAARCPTAQPNYRYTLQQLQPATASEAESLQYALAKLRVPQAHDVSTGDNVLVAVIDTSIDTAHPEIAGLVAGSFDATNATATSPHRHGTAMAGAIVAHARLKGVAPTARILAIHAFDASRAGADGTTLTILRSIDWAVAHGARVINMSFAGPNDPGLARGLAAARQKGVVLVAAAGNAGPKSPPLFPAADPNVIAVTATNADDKLLGAANRGRHIAVAAPGVDIVGPAPGGNYQLSTGTSVAAAHVRGVVALLLARKPDLTPEAVRRILLSSATDLGPKGRDDQFGAGLTDAYRAVQSLDADAPASVSAAR